MILTFDSLALQFKDYTDVKGAQKSNETLSKTERKPENVENNQSIVFCFFVYSGAIEPFFVKI